MSEYEIELEIRKMRKNHMIRRRGEEDIRPVNSEHEEAPPTKKKRVWNNFGTGRKRKNPDEIEEKRKPKETRLLQNASVKSLDFD